MMTIIRLYIISIDNIFTKLIISTFVENTIKFNIYTMISNIKVVPNTINIIVARLSFEKFLSNVADKKPITPNPAAFIPICIPIVKSNIAPIITPYITPVILLENSPINKIYITNKFGITPEIVNQLKKFDCKKYKMNAVNIRNILIVNFFNDFTLSVF